MLVGDFNEAAFLQYSFVNLRSLNVNNIKTCSSTKYRDKYVTMPDLVYSNLSYQNCEWNPIPNFTIHKEVQVTLLGEFDREILYNAIKLRLQGKLSLL